MVDERYHEVPTYPQALDQTNHRARVAAEIDWLSSEAYRIAAEHGFHDDDASVTIERRLMLITSEVVEAFEEYRSAHEPSEIYYGENGKPEGVPVELADVVIRVLDFAATYGINIGDVIIEKMLYNEGRPHKHGRQF